MDDIWQEISDDLRDLEEDFESIKRQIDAMDEGERRLNLFAQDGRSVRCIRQGIEALNRDVEEDIRDIERCLEQWKRLEEQHGGDLAWVREFSHEYTVKLPRQLENRKMFLRYNEIRLHILRRLDQFS